MYVPTGMRNLRMELQDIASVVRAHSTLLRHFSVLSANVVGTATVMHCTNSTLRFVTCFAEAWTLNEKLKGNIKAFR